MKLHVGECNSSTTVNRSESASKAFPARGNKIFVPFSKRNRRRVAVGGRVPCAGSTVSYLHSNRIECIKRNGVRSSIES